mgnify:CR=1 FL=1
MTNPEKGNEQEGELFRLRNLSQIFLMDYMIKKGVIKDIEEYINKGFAEAFDMLSRGELAVPEVDWPELAKRVAIITGKIKGKVDYAIPFINITKKT